MKGDFSRKTFNPGNNYRSVLQQQGRVSVDADFNEEVDILNTRIDSTAASVVGDVARGKNNFSISVKSDGTLSIGPGVLYLHGIPCVNGTECGLGTQPYLPVDNPSQASFPDLTASTSYVVYLRAFERLITAVQDPAIREKALGGADTAVRTQWVWQVRLAPAVLPNPIDCVNASFWQPAFNPGKMTAGTVALATGSSPCVLPPQANFRGLENQLYRVEIHNGGPLATATCKWSRENGSVLTAVIAGSAASGPTAGPVLNVASVGRDADLGFGNQQFVELLDDAIELWGKPQPLSTVKNVTASLNQIELQAAASLPVNFDRAPRLRRWDHTTGDANGIPLATGSITLENGIAVTFSAGDYRAGDYWLIPARTAIDADTGTIEWPVDGSGTHLPLPSRQVEYRQILTAVTWNGSAFALAPGARNCVPQFPVLSAIGAEDVSFDSNCGILAGVTNVDQALEALCAHQGPCTVVVAPPQTAGDPWWDPLLALPAGKDAEICFQAGTFPLSGQGLALTKLGHLKLTGAGNGTKITSTGEACLTFNQCASVIVRDLAVTASATNAPQLNGALTFIDCNDVVVESVTAQTSDDGSVGSACIAVRPQGRRNPATTASLRVRGCTLNVGWQKHGILGVNVLRAQIEDNEIVCNSTQTITVNTVTKSNALIKQLAGVLVSGLRVLAPQKTTPPPAPAPAPTPAPTPVPAPAPTSPQAKKQAGTVNLRETVANKINTFMLPTKHDTSVKVGESSVVFTSDPRFRNAFSTYVAKNAPADATPTATAKNINQLAIDFAKNPQLWQTLPGFVNLVQSFPVTGLRGICLAGSSLREARIVNNSILRFREGVHIGLSHSEVQRGAPDIADNILIQNNRIEVSMLPGDEVAAARLRGPFAIYVGNVNHLMVVDNQTTVKRNNADLPAQAGVVVYGWLGPRIIARGNSVSGFRTGFVVTPSKGMALPLTRLWMVTENIITGGGSIASGPLNPPITSTININ
ncbi:hypothetical protein Terro_2521 [Terriglobus roseus DSM 18391]|uniref:Right handed beta helix region n=1 Tax=Terriglobus roseus (strain DSM 18391 / NRRL B-41598 / KBS 63) TaxID=926566 RepID=I3ZGQ7_TERRK|nr:DUF6519 domain-containing protein [Terriglobus roseus]AFL88425.1 hypothetical protein Terro_2157 [Terriglobus roseus DSM 18391]AFL88767.1 hypothetical protein Terro_2521 [Terriglobus roseus DSM 18391]